MLTKKFYWSGVAILLLCFFLPRVSAQTYEQMWKQVEAMEQKQLPKSAAVEAQKIYNRAKHEKNVFQMLKASLMKSSFSIEITPDSLSAEMQRLRAWASEENDPVCKAVLNYLVGYYILDTGKKDEATIDSAIAYFRLARRDKEILGKTSAKECRPLTISKTLSEKYCNDNMLHLIAWQSVYRLKVYFQADPLLLEKTQVEILSIYDELIAYYKKAGMRDAQLLTMLGKIYYEGNDISRGGVNEKSRLTNEQVITSLKQWCVEFKDSPLCGEVYCMLASRHDEMEDYVSKLETARMGLEKYPASLAANDLKEQIAEVLTPRLMINIPFNYPGVETELKATYRNLKGFTLELYRMSLPVTSNKLEGELDASLLSKYGKQVDSRHYVLATTPDYKMTDTLFHYSFPAEGIYVLKSIPDDNPRQAAYDRVYVSSLQAITLGLPGGEKEIQVVDKLTGQPVGRAEVAYYRVVPEEGYRQIKTYATDSKGCVRLTSPREVGNWLGVNVRRPGADYMKIVYDGFSNAGYSWLSAQAWEKRVSLFTDRALYRPGQIVHVSGLAYEQSGDEAHVLHGTTHEVILSDANRQEIRKLNLKADNFGNFYGEFILPENLLPGEFEIAVKDGESRYIRVDEYKRPTFDITFFPDSSTYRMGDTLLIKGEAKTFAGIPVGECRLNYKITRCRKEFWKIPDEETTLGAGRLQTDEKGNFRIPVFLRQPDNYRPGVSGCYYTYTVTVEVMNNMGEIQRNSFPLSVGEQSLALYIEGLRLKLACEKKDSICILATNWNRQPVKVQATYRVYPLNEDNKKGNEVCCRTVETREFFVPDDILTLGAGRYRMEVTATDHQGRVCKTEQDFVLFSLEDCHLPMYAPEWFYQDGVEFTDTKPVDLYVGSSEKDVYLLYDVFWGNRRIESRRLTLNNEIRKFSYTYRPEYGDGITVNFAFMRRGVLYSKRVEIIRPRPKKKLHLKWKTFRDKLQPGQQEIWELQITSPDKKPVDASLLATLYDASLDKLYVNDWNFNLNFPHYTPQVSVSSLAGLYPIYLYSNFPYSGSAAHGISWWSDFSRLYPPCWRTSMLGSGWQEKQESKMAKLPEADIPEDKSALDKGFDRGDESVTIVEFQSRLIKFDDGSSYIPLRENFAETAFFYPTLRTDSNGIVRISFLLPESLTEWKFMGLAHTRNMNYGQILAKAKAVKPFMVQPNMPRFVRVNDKSVISATITNISGNTIQGMARMELADAQTNEIISTQQSGFQVETNEVTTVSFDVEAIEEHPVLICRIIAEDGEFSDGEQHYLPVLPDRQWITETVPVQLNGTGSISVALDKMFNEGSKTAKNKRLTVELTANPIWYVVQSLPVISSPSDEDALSLATAYYANSLSKAIIISHPSLRHTFESWKVQENNVPSLSKRKELKGISLETTPWVAAAANEEEQKRKVALLFEQNTMEERNRRIIDRLEKLQLSDGALSWYKGMGGNRYVTTQIVELLARLRAMNVATASVEKLYNKALTYLHARWMENYKKMRAEEKKGKKNLMPDEQSVHYLYIAALDPHVAQLTDKAAYIYMIDKLENSKMNYTIYDKARIATILQSAGKTTKAQEYARSIMEYSVYTPEMGRHFDTPKATYSWNSYRIPTQVAAIEALSHIIPDEAAINEMKQWLLKQKQVQVWATPIATADAIYAFLDNSQLAFAKQQSCSMKATIGVEEILTPPDALGYTSRSFSEEKTIPASAIEITHSGDGIGWGTVYAQYTENLDKVHSPGGKGLKISRTYYKDGKEISEKETLYIGDELTVALTVKSDRDMDFVRIKDTRAACMEPKDALSGYHFRNGVGYYQVTRDTSTEVFIDKFHKGTISITYKVYLDRPGTYQTGAATVQSVYAPEFRGHARSMKVKGINPKTLLVVYVDNPKKSIFAFPLKSNTP